MRERNQRGLCASQLRSHHSQSPSSPCAEWRTQHPSSGYEGDEHGQAYHHRNELWEPELIHGTRHRRAGEALDRGVRRSELLLQQHKESRQQHEERLDLALKGAWVLEQSVVI